LLTYFSLNVVAQACAGSIVANTLGTHKPTQVEVYDISGEPLNPKTITCLFENGGGRLEQDHWIDIRRVKAVNQDERNTYSILDFDYPLNQENYYQLVEITFDGNKTDLGIATVDNRINNKNIVAIYDTLGNVVNENYTGLVIILYEDGSTTKAYR